MKMYVCSICGYCYDEALGQPDGGIAPGTSWEALPADWVCPLCGASKAEFAEQTVAADQTRQAAPHEPDHEESLRALSWGELSALCSNLSKGCEKQYLTEESALFQTLSTYFQQKSAPASNADFDALIALLEQDLSENYPAANAIASDVADRGALRALVWGEKVTKILASLLNRYQTQQNALLENTHVFVCEICGFVYIGDVAPAICPVCKVPNIKLKQIQRG